MTILKATVHWLSQLKHFIDFENFKTLAYISFNKRNRCLSCWQMFRCVKILFTKAQILILKLKLAANWKVMKLPKTGRWPFSYPSSKVYTPAVANDSSPSSMIDNFRAFSIGVAACVLLYVDNFAGFTDTISLIQETLDLFSTFFLQNNNNSQPVITIKQPTNSSCATKKTILTKVGN